MRKRDLSDECKGILKKIQSQIHFYTSKIVPYLYFENVSNEAIKELMKLGFKLKFHDEVEYDKDGDDYQPPKIQVIWRWKEDISYDLIKGDSDGDDDDDYWAIK